MPIRRMWRKGDWLVFDEESGHVIYASEAARNWDGTWRRKNKVDPPQRQEFVKARRDPEPLTEIQPDAPYPEPSNIIPLTIGETNIKTKPGPARGVFEAGVLGGDPGVGQMTIEASATEGPFMVR